MQAWAETTEGLALDPTASETKDVTFTSLGSVPLSSFVPEVNLIAKSTNIFAGLANQGSLQAELAYVTAHATGGTRLGGLAYALGQAKQDEAMLVFPADSPPVTHDGVVALAADRKQHAGWSGINPRSTPGLTTAPGRRADTEGMTFTDYLLDGTLIALVLLQIRGRRITIHTLALPIGIVILAALQYLHGIPTSGNDLGLVLAGTLTGLVLGAGCGLATAVYRNSAGAAIAKAGPVAALLWVAGVGARLAFSEYASHGGQGAIGRFSTTHHITSAEAWVACLVLMALAEVVSRTAVIAVRFAALGGDRSTGAAQTWPQRAIMEFRGRWS